MTRERLKEEAIGIAMMDKTFSTSIEIRMSQIIERQDAYIDLLEGDGWQDIATAPQDGTSIMLYDGNYSDGVYEGYYYKTELGYDDAWYDSAHNQTSPKSWKPLPSPPKQG